MKKKNLKSKLVLNKKTVAILNDTQQLNLLGARMHQYSAAGESCRITCTTQIVDGGMCSFVTNCTIIDL